MCSYIEKMFKRFKLVPKQSIDTSLPEGIASSLQHAEPADSAFTNDFEYRQKIGCLLYLMVCVRPDICFAVGLLARQCNNVSRAAAAGVTRLLQYVYNTKKMVLVLGGKNAYTKAFSDSDWAGDRMTRLSTGSYDLFLGEGVVDWGSYRHRIPAQSTAEAEYLTLNGPARAILWLRWLLSETKIKSIITSYSSTIFTDSTAAQAMAENPISSERTKHIAIKYHFIRTLIDAGVIVLEHVDTLLNVADIGTKPLGKRTFANLCKLVMGHEPSVKPTKRKRTEQSDEFV
jgi:hypothetical protein